MAAVGVMCVVEVEKRWKANRGGCEGVGGAYMEGCRRPRKKARARASMGLIGHILWLIAGAMGGGRQWWRNDHAESHSSLPHHPFLLQPQTTATAP